jgi:cytochrome c553
MCVALFRHARRTPLNGRLLAGNCFRCHGTNGQGPGFDRLNDKSAREIYRELREMKSDEVRRRR